MTKTWTLEEAEAQLSQLIRDAATEPQVITQNGKALVIVNAINPEEKKMPLHTALEALRGDYDFSDFPQEDWLGRL